MTAPSNVGKWTPWYQGLEQPGPYGDRRTYEWAEEWLHHTPVEDWGCGKGWFRQIHEGEYRGVDGTATPWCDEVVDLVHYRSQGWNILLKDVLEHNHDWQPILDNAVVSFDRRLLILVFTPLQVETRVLVENVDGLGVPDIGFKLSDLTDRLTGCRWFIERWHAVNGYENTEVAIKVQHA